MWLLRKLERLARMRWSLSSSAITTTVSKPHSPPAPMRLSIKLRRGIVWSKACGPPPRAYRLTDKPPFSFIDFLSNSCNNINAHDWLPPSAHQGHFFHKPPSPREASRKDKSDISSSYLGEVSLSDRGGQFYGGSHTEKYCPKAKEMRFLLRQLPCIM